LLKQRKRNKKNQELEKQRLEEKMKQLENQDKVTADSHTDYIKDLFTNNG